MVKDGEAEGDVDRASLGMNLARKILNNITVELEDLTETDDWIRGLLEVCFFQLRVCE